MTRCSRRGASTERAVPGCAARRPGARKALRKLTPFSSPVATQELAELRRVPIRPGCRARVAVAGRRAGVLESRSKPARRSRTPSPRRRTASTRRDCPVADDSGLAVDRSTACRGAIGAVVRVHGRDEANYRLLLGQIDGTSPRRGARAAFVSRLVSRAAGDRRPWRYGAAWGAPAGRRLRLRPGVHPGEESGPLTAELSRPKDAVSHRGQAPQPHWFQPAGAGLDPPIRLLNPARRDRPRTAVRDG